MISLLETLLNFTGQMHQEFTAMEKPQPNGQSKQKYFANVFGNEVGLARTPYPPVYAV